MEMFILAGRKESLAVLFLHTFWLKLALHCGLNNSICRLSVAYSVSAFNSKSDCVQGRECRQISGAESEQICAVLITFPIV